MINTLDAEATALLAETCKKPPPLPAYPLPPAFDQSCRKCDVKMERTEMPVWTRHRPFAIFQCPDCDAQLFLFRVPTATLLVWRSTIPSGSSIVFSDFIDQKIEEHERKRQIRIQREQAVTKTAV